MDFNNFYITVSKKEASRLFYIGEKVHLLKNYTISDEVEKSPSEYDCPYFAFVLDQKESRIIKNKLKKARELRWFYFFLACALLFFNTFLVFSLIQSGIVSENFENFLLGFLSSSWDGILILTVGVFLLVNLFKKFNESLSLEIEIWSNIMDKYYLVDSKERYLSGGPV